MHKEAVFIKMYILDVLKEHSGQRSLILDLHNEHLDWVILHFRALRLRVLLFDACIESQIWIVQ